MSAEALHREMILDHARRPHRAGLREPFDAEASQVNPTCGDRATVRVRLDGDTVCDVTHAVLGCTVSQASTSVMTDLVIGRTAGEALAVHERFRALLTTGPLGEEEDALGDAVAFTGVARYPARVRCALLGWAAFADALRAARAAREVQP